VQRPDLGAQHEAQPVQAQLFQRLPQRPWCPGQQRLRPQAHGGAAIDHDGLEQGLLTGEVGVERGLGYAGGARHRVHRHGGIAIGHE
jgi:hypothetical protein